MAKDSNNGLKAPGLPTVFRNEQELNDFLRCADKDNGWEYFARNFFMITHPTRGLIKFDPYPFQVDMLSTFHNYRRCVTVNSRQSGKSTVAAAYLLWYAMFIPDSTLIIASYRYASAIEIMDRIRVGIENCPDHIKAGISVYNQGSVKFDNGSRIIAQTTTMNTGRGMSISVLYLDEFAFCPKNIASGLWASLAPTLATGGKSIVTSTPNSTEDTFYEIWTAANQTEDEYGNQTDVGINGYKAFTAAWNLVPGRDEKWAATMRADLGDEKFEREILCEFIIDAETLIKPIFLKTMRGVDPIKTINNVRWYNTPTCDGPYCIGLDPSAGTGGDFAAIQVFEVLTGKQIAEWKHNKTEISDQLRIISQIVDELIEMGVDSKDIYWGFESNGVGEACVQSLKDFGSENIRANLVNEPGKKRSFAGWTTTSKSKNAACTRLKNMLENEKLTVFSRPLVSEIKTYVSGGGSFKAQLGSHDDLVSALLIVIRLIGYLSDYFIDVSEVVRDHKETILPMPFYAVFG